MSKHISQIFSNRKKTCANILFFFNFAAVHLGTITLQLVGGYKEESGKGGVLSKRILSFFATHHLTFKLNLVCLGPVNTKLKSRPEPIVGGVLCDLSKGGKLYPATFNRSFVDGMPEDTINTLMLGPSLIKRPERLKKMILEHEDKGYSAKNRAQ